MSRLIASLIAALALILSPVVMTGAAVASSHQAMAMEMAGPMAGHCEGMLPVKSDSKGAMKIDCAAACSALQPLPPLLAQRGCFAAAAPARLAVAQLDGITIGHEPPPPRFSPEI
jgi:hypothetical protein